MHLTGSNSDLFSAPGFLVSPVGKRGMGAQKRKRKKKGMREKGNRKGKGGRKKE